MATSAIISRFSPLLAGAILLAACSDSTGPGNGDLQIRAFARGGAQQAPSARAVTGAFGEAAAVSALRVERVLLVLGRIKLEKAADWPTDYVDERSVVVSLTPNGEPVLALDADIPGGRYKELELAFDKLEPGKAQEASLIQQYPALANASVLIEGRATVNGVDRSFSFASALDMDVEVQFNPPLTLDDGPDPALLSVVLDIDGWFRDASGRLLDPTASSDRSAIEGNIDRSIHLFEDPERDGR